MSVDLTRDVSIFEALKPVPIAAFCAKCGADYQETFAPKPATPEATTPLYQRLADFMREHCGDQVHASQRRVCDKEWDEWYSRALDDFIARRKAKRTLAEAQAEAFGHMTAPKAREIAEAQERAFGRAMSTPLPHDPPMSVRLMPWRGKE